MLIICIVTNLQCRTDNTVYKIYKFQVPLGILFKNENLNDDMIDILEHLHSEYVTTQAIITEDGEVTEVIESVFFGGDQLTKERGRNAKDAWGGWEHKL